MLQTKPAPDILKTKPTNHWWFQRTEAIVLSEARQENKNGIKREAIVLSKASREKHHALERNPSRNTERLPPEALAIPIQLQQRLPNERFESVTRRRPRGTIRTRTTRRIKRLAVPPNCDLRAGPEIAKERKRFEARARTRRSLLVLPTEGEGGRNEPPSLRKWMPMWHPRKTPKSFWNRHCHQIPMPRTAKNQMPHYRA
mmetsp:Transcript_22067/g.54583  ORF Transcript_22067/g.54583 Transcript_22067/m.54583 type:complete len:200 (-) Transcript_22067:1704-2303(-)